MKRKLPTVFLAIGCLLLVSLQGISQTLPPPDIDRTIIPLAPDVTDFTRYGDIPVNLSRGIPNVEIPIFSSKLGQLPIDISLSYSYSGLRPTETPGWVGLGWNLNAGGVISREVRQLIDEANVVTIPDGPFDSIPDASWYQSNQEFLTEAGTRERDAEADVYTYSFPGHSGKFILKNNRAVTFPYDNINITRNALGFIILAEDGTQHLFQSTETTTTKLYGSSNSVSAYTSAWHLTKSISPNKTDTLVYTYRSTGYSDNATTNNQIYSYSDQTYDTVLSCITDYRTYNPATTINSLQLTSIYNKDLQVYFDLDTVNLRKDISTSSAYYSLKDVTVYGSASNLVRQVKFGYGYFFCSASYPTFNGYKLKLQQVTATDSLTGAIPVTDLVYRFNYQHETDTFPYNYTNGLDIFGYYNGKDGNGDLGFSTPSNYLPVRCVSGGIQNDRNPYLSYTQYGALTKVTYPTGGYSSITYEANPGPGIRIRSYNSYDSFSTVTATKNIKYTFNDGITSSIAFLDGAQMFRPMGYYYVQGTYPNGTSPGHHQIVASLENIAGVPLNKLSPIPFYYSQVTVEDSSGGEIHRSIHEFGAQGGGATEVYPVLNTDFRQVGNSFLPRQTDSMNYNLVPDTSVTSLVIKFDQALTSPTIPTNQDNFSRLQLYRSEPYVVSSVQNCLLNKTSTSFGDGGGSIAVAHCYYYDNIDHRQLTRDVYINSKGDTITTQYTYPFDYSCGCDPRAAETQFKTNLQSLYATYQACNTQRNQCTLGASTCYNNFPCEANSYNSFTTVKQTLQASNASYTNCLQTAINNASDSNLKAIYIMQRDHQLSPVVETFVFQKKAGAGNASPLLLSAVKKEFTLSSNGVVIPKAIWKIDTSMALNVFLANESAYYNRKIDFVYDGIPNLIQQNKENDVVTSYIYDNADPHLLLAKILNSTISQVAYTSFENGQTGNWQIGTGSFNSGNGYNSKTSFNGTLSSNIPSGSYTLTLWQKAGQGFSVSVDNSAISIPQPLLTKNGWNLYQLTLSVQATVSITGNYLDECRLYPAGSQMTTWSYVPAVGISTVCDANNNYTFYSYDGIGRLQSIKDQDGNIIKTLEYHYKGQ